MPTILEIVKADFDKFTIEQLEQEIAINNDFFRDAWELNGCVEEKEAQDYAIARLSELKNQSDD